MTYYVWSVIAFGGDYARTYGNAHLIIVKAESLEEARLKFVEKSLKNEERRQSENRVRLIVWDSEPKELDSLDYLYLCYDGGSIQFDGIE